MRNEAGCRVCGYMSDMPPWGEDGRTPDFELCPCCGVQHGYQDCNSASCLEYRRQWLADGARWAEPKLRPDRWSVDEQLRNILDEHP